MVKTCILALLIFLYAAGSFAQSGNEWTLQKAIQYAMENNLTIQQNVLNARLAKLRSTQAQLSQLPNINASGFYGKSYGRSVNPVTNQFVDASYSFSTLSGNADVLLFGWFQKRNLINQGKLIQQATEADLDQAKNDISLNLATAYLRTAMANERIKVDERQIAFSKKQLEQARLIVKSGIAPELEVVQIASQLASDSAKLMASIAQYNASILDIKALLNMEIATPFSVSLGALDISKAVTSIPTTPEEIYNTAQQRMGNIRSSNLRIAAAEKAYKATKASLLPQLGLVGQWGTNYSSLSKQLNNTGYSNMQVSGSYVDVAGNQYPIYQLTPVYTTSDIAFGQQLSNNSRSNIALSLNVPIFNGWRVMTATKEAKIQVEAERLNKRATEVGVKQGVYNAYNEAKTSLQRFYAAERAEAAAKKALEYMEQRYSAGLDNTVNYLVVQNRLFEASYETLSAKYDLVLKLKTLDYYMGNALTL